MLDLYCERTAVGLWNEPLNLLTNLAFLLAAISVARRLHATGLSLRNSWDLQLLIALVGGIGVGSGLWHSFASDWAEWADVLPIGLFMAVYLLSFLARVASLSVPGMIFWLLLFESINLGLPSFVSARVLNGSVFYLPALISLLSMWLYARRHRPETSAALLAGSVLFTVSLGARTVDNLVCPFWPLGTHFLWHLLNAELLRRLILVLLQDRIRVRQADTATTGAWRHS